MNKTLKFSWGHIIAFLALIAVSYISFVGFTYLKNGNFTIALIEMGITDLFYIFVFIGAQQLKASGVKMKRKIIWERILLFVSPLIFIVGMISMSHFWTVRSRDQLIVEQFSNSIESAKQLFDDYEDYSNKRIEKYESTLNNIIGSQYSKPDLFKNAGFQRGKTDVQKANMVETLRLQLLSTNYYNLKNKAIKWIDEANQGASTWNVFLLGNTREIKSSIAEWENQLKSFSAKEMTNESLTAQYFTKDQYQRGDIFDEEEKFISIGAKKAIDGIDGLTSAFTKPELPNVYAIVFGIILYFMLLFPYLIQERHSKSSYKTIGKKISNKSKITISSDNSKNAPLKGTFRL